jgi:hypothetical protein
VEPKPASEAKKKLAEAKPAVEADKKLAEAKPASAPVKKKPAMIDDDLVKDIRAAAKAESKGSGSGR